MHHADFPVAPPRFAALPGASRSRVMLVSGEDTPAPTVDQVATVPGEVDVVELVTALNEAAWGVRQMADLDQILSGIPEAAARSCRQTLSALPPARQVLTNFGCPVRVIRESWLRYSSTEVPDVLGDAAEDLGLQLLVTNELDEDGVVEFRSRLLSHEMDFTSLTASDWWPLPDGASVVARMTSMDHSIDEIFTNPRWETQLARACWGWLPDADDEDSGTLYWVAEFLDAPLEPARNFRVFIETEPEDDSALTPRNRFVLWQSLGSIAADLDGALASSVDWDPDASVTVQDMPRIVRNQPREWWSAMEAAALALTEAARIGDIDRLVPRTPAEEALLALATREGYIDGAFDLISDLDLDGRYDQLEESDNDGEFEEVLGELLGDVDIKMLWSDSMDGIEHPADATNGALGMGDYRPSTWHEPTVETR